MGEIKQELVAEYQRGLLESPGQANRLYAIAILRHALASNTLTAVPRQTIDRTLSILDAGLLSDEEAEVISDDLLDYLVAKNGSSVVRIDHEDRVIKACLEAFHPSVEYDGLEACAGDVEDLLLGGGSDFRIL